MLFIKLLLAGIICGIISSTPPGPINLLIADRVLQGKHFNFKPFLSGILLADVLFAVMAFWGYYQFLSETVIGKGMTITGGIFIIGLGLINLIKARNSKVELKHSGEPLERPKASFIGEFLSGAFLCGSNPGFLVWWIFVATQFQTLGLEEFNFVQMTIICGGIIIGDLIWFKAYIHLLSKGIEKLKGDWINQLRGGVAILLMVLGIITIVKTLL